MSGERTGSANLKNKLFILSMACKNTGKSSRMYVVNAKLIKPPGGGLKDQCFFMKSHFLGEALGGAVTRRLHVFHLYRVHW